MNHIWLDNFLTAISNSVAAARRVFRDQHLADLASHWENVQQDAGLAASRTKTVRLQIEHGDGATSSLDVPTAALVQHNSMVLDTISFEIECTLTSFDRNAKDGADRVAICFGRSGENGAPASAIRRPRKTIARA